jgi:hypothetical protein
MKNNVGWVERTVRILIGVPTATAYLYVRHFSHPWSHAFLIVGLALTMTAASGWCPIHRLFGTSSVKRPVELSPQPQDLP